MRLGLEPKERVMNGEEYDETIIIERLAAISRPGRGVLRSLEIIRGVGCDVRGSPPSPNMRDDAQHRLATRGDRLISL
jgi:hypothetical protein